LDKKIEDFKSDKNLLKKQEKMKEFSEIYIEFLNLESVIDPIMEASGLFFEKYCSGARNYEKIKHKVMADYIEKYIEEDSQMAIIDSRLYSLLAYSNINPETSKYVYYTKALQRNLAETNKHNISLRKVDFEVFNEIYYDFLPHWKSVFVKNCNMVTEALVEAYSKDPSRLKNITKIKSFEDFLEICYNKQ
jgi:hypothetical protein